MVTSTTRASFADFARLPEAEGVIYELDEAEPLTEPSRLLSVPPSQFLCVWDSGTAVMWVSTGFAVAMDLHNPLLVGTVPGREWVLSCLSTRPLPPPQQREPRALSRAPARDGMTNQRHPSATFVILPWASSLCIYPSYRLVPRTRNESQIYPSF